MLYFQAVSEKSAKNKGLLFCRTLYINQLRFKIQKGILELGKVTVKRCCVKQQPAVYVLDAKTNNG